MIELKGLWDEGATGGWGVTGGERVTRPRSRTQVFFLFLSPFPFPFPFSFSLFPFPFSLFPFPFSLFPFPFLFPHPPSPRQTSFLSTESLPDPAAGSKKKGKGGIVSLYLLENQALRDFLTAPTGVLRAAGGEGVMVSVSLTNRDLFIVPPRLIYSPNLEFLRVLNLSRNNLEVLPPEVFFFFFLILYQNPSTYSLPHHQHTQQLTVQHHAFS